jgi:hypothetical protein
MRYYKTPSLILLLYGFTIYIHSSRSTAHPVEKLGSIIYKRIKNLDVITIKEKLIEIIKRRRRNLKMLLSFYVKDIESLLADACERSLLHNNNTTFVATGDDTQ